MNRYLLITIVCLLACIASYVATMFALWFMLLIGIPKVIANAILLVMVFITLAVNIAVLKEF